MHLIYKTREMARADVFDYIEMFYNRIRRHSHLDGISPEAFEAASKWGCLMSRILGAVQIDYSPAFASLKIFAANKFYHATIVSFKVQAFFTGDCFNSFSIKINCESFMCFWIVRGGSGNLNNTYKWYFAPQMML